MPKHLNRPSNNPPPYPWKDYVESLESKIHRLQNELDKMRAAAQQPDLFGGDPALATGTAPTLEMGEAEAPTGRNALFDSDPTANSMGGFTADSETSRQAAMSNYPRSGSQRHQILLAIFKKGAHGMTFDECKEELGIYSADRRLSDLVDGGWCERTERTRKTTHGEEASVVVTTQKATEWIARNETQLYREVTRR